MTITAHVGQTKLSEACAELWDGDKLILKAYPNADGSRIRIVLPELCSMKQTLIDDEAHWLEFSRSEDDALPNANRAPIAAARVACSIPGCTKQASFIVDREAYCAEHRR